MTTIGTSIPRLEERKLLTGVGQFTADVRPADAVHAVFVRSPHAHARIIAIDTQAARRAGGVLAVLTGDDAQAAGTPHGTPLKSFVAKGRPSSILGCPTIKPDVLVKAATSEREQPAAA